MAEDKKKAVKKKISKKKTTKKVVRKKVVKKATSKKTTKKTEKRKGAKKVLRKKATQKKPIRLKADSPELDSFASHAAENVEAIEAAAVSLETAPAASKPEKTPASKAKPVKATSPKIEKTKPAKKEDKISKSQVASATKPEPIYKKTSSSSESESFTSKLIIAAVLFLGVGIYLITIPDEEVNNQTSAKPTVVSIKEDVKTSAAPKVSIVTDNTAEKSDINKVKADKTTPIKTTEMTVKSEQGSPVTDQKGKSLAEELNEEALRQPIAKIETEQATGEKLHFPPPPTPDFLQNTATKPLPENQMEMIKDLFAPELR